VRAAIAATVNGRRIPAVLAVIAVAFSVASCDRAPDKSAAAKPELIPTPPAIAAPPANPPPVMPPPAANVLPSSGSEALPSTPEKAKPETGTPADSGGDKPDASKTAQGSDPTAKQAMSKDEEANAMPKPAQANDHSTTATDGKQ
jgi:hypothetical protein